MMVIALTLLIADAQASESFDGKSFYIGDLHAHSGVSGDGGSSDVGHCEGSCAALADVYDTARDNGLDFMALTDHINGENTGSEEEYQLMLDTTFDAHDPENGFVTIPGGEVWFGIDGVAMGHKNIFWFGSDEQLQDLNLTNARHSGGAGDAIDDCESIWEYAAEQTAMWGPMMLIPHHPGMAMGMGTHWGCHNYEEAQLYAPTIEVYSEHGNSTVAGATYDELWLGYEEGMTVDAALNPESWSYRLGFVGGTDSHDTRPGGVCSTDTEHSQHPYGGGLTVTVLDEGADFDRMAIYEAIVNRQTYVTSGPLVPVTETYSSGLAELGTMGEELGLPPDQDLDVEVAVPEEWVALIDGVHLRGPDFETEMQYQGDGKYGLTVSSEEVPAYLYPWLEVDGEQYYDGEECSDGGESQAERLWLSPTWFDAGEPDLDGDGISWNDGDCHDGDDRFYPGANEYCWSSQDRDCDGTEGTDEADCLGHTVLDAPPSEIHTFSSPATIGAGDDSSEVENEMEDSPGEHVFTDGPHTSPSGKSGCSTVTGVSALTGTSISWLLAFTALARRREE